jgi:hypothetical protein
VIGPVAGAEPCSTSALLCRASPSPPECLNDEKREASVLPARSLADEGQPLDVAPDRSGIRLVLRRHVVRLGDLLDREVDPLGDGVDHHLARQTRFWVVARRSKVRNPCDTEASGFCKPSGENSYCFVIVLILSGARLCTDMLLRSGRTSPPHGRPVRPSPPSTCAIAARALRIQFAHVSASSLALAQRLHHSGNSAGSLAFRISEISSRSLLKNVY